MMIMCPEPEARAAALAAMRPMPRNRRVRTAASVRMHVWMISHGGRAVEKRPNIPEDDSEEAAETRLEDSAAESDAAP
jgi:hypothetical protein